jgi:putative hydrolase of the HAD superfamily
VLFRSHTPTYLFSNTHALHYEYIQENYAFPRHVHGVVLSHELGMRKPEPRIYAAALKIAKVSQPSAALFIDDLEANVAAARQAGLQAIRYRGSEDLFRRLQTLGVLKRNKPDK